MKSAACTNCPTAKVASLLSDQWTMLIIRDLLRAPMRFSELLASLHGVSTRTLVLKLKRLEDMDIITKQDPWYTMTPSGKKIKPILDEMEKYGKKFL
jgi:DNA-binding HxlR family transcriptional regulator